MDKKYSLNKNNIENILDLTSLQEGLLFHYLNNIESNLYFVQLSLEINGVIIKDHFEKAWKRVVENNEMLRTEFRWQKLNKPVQIILKETNIDIRYYDLSTISSPILEEEFQRVKLKDYNEVFDLREVPFRLTLCKFNNNKYYLLVSNHHIIYDGWSNGIILNEFLNYYNEEVNGKIQKSIQKKSFKHYIKINNEINPDGKIFWNEYLNGYELNSVFRSNYDNSILDSNECSKIVITEDKAKLLKKCCELNGLTISDILYSIWGILLCKYSGEEDVIFGTTVSGRNIKLDGIENMVGLFINTIPLRFRLSTSKSFIEIISENVVHLRERGHFENIPLLKILDYTGYKGDELFESIFVIENYPLDRSNLKHREGIVFKSFTIKESTNYKITVSASLDDEIEINFYYSTKRIEKEIIENIGKHYIRIIDYLLNNQNTDIQSLDLLSNEEKYQLLYSFNNTKEDYPDQKTIQKIIEEQILINPESIAVYEGDKRLTYKELGDMSDLLAESLLNFGVKKNDIIPILLERSVNVIIAILGILKSGGIFLPVDVNSPRKRILYILKDSDNDLILTNKDIWNNLNLNGRAVFVESLFNNNELLLKRSINTVTTDGVYIIYTSGTTGNPKGSLICQGGLVNYITWANIKYVQGEKLDFPLFSSLAFDLTITSIFTPLISGNGIVIYNENENEILIDRILDDNKVGVIKLTPSHLKVIKERDDKKFILDDLKLKRLIVGGEQLNAELTREIYNKFLGQVEIYNEYGPTETTVGCIYYKFEKEKKIGLSVPIGRPIANCNIYILDNDKNTLPVGVFGELYISGVGVAIGYLDLPELTSEKFITHPFKEGETLYKTGDLARWLPDGNIEFLGRIDHQVKIRGYRVELEEIESTLQKHNQVKECLVVAREEVGDKHLCAYLVLHGELNSEDLRDYLSGLLPDYMIPSYFVRLDFIPLTSNGKVDRRSLPAPEVSVGGGYIAPRTHLEIRLVEIWSEILSIAPQEISIGVSFFALGGHSLRATTLVLRIHREFDVRLGLRDIFQHQTVQGQSALIRLSEKASYASIPTAKAKDYYPLSSAQKRLYLLQQLDLESTAYNMTGLLRVPKGQSRQQIGDIFKQVIQRHDSLRTIFEVIEEQPVQRVHSEVLFTVTVYRVEVDGLPRLREDFVRPFDLSRAPLLRVGYVEVTDGDDVLLIDMHHIVSDGRSLSILAKEFERLASGQKLPPLRLQYKDYSEWQSDPEQQSRISSQERYWLARFAGELPVLALPTDYPRPVIQEFEGALVTFSLTREESQILLNICKEQGITLYMSILSVFTILLSKLSGQEDIVVGSPIAARRHADLEGVVGMFVNSLALRNEVIGTYRLIDYLQKVKLNTLEAYENQEYPFEDLVERVTTTRDTSRNPVFDVMFNLLEGDSIEYLEPLGSALRHTSGVAKFDLSLTAISFGADLKFSFEYRTKLFREDTIVRFIGYLRQLLKVLSANLNCFIKDVDVLSKEEKFSLLHDFNRTDAAYPKEKYIHELFEEQAFRTPDSVALIYNDEFLTYSELSFRSNQLASCLIDKGFGGNNLVGIMVDRSLDMVISILGILRSGNAYVPIDPDSPRNRVSYILKDNSVKVLILQDSFVMDFDFSGEILSHNDIFGFPIFSEEVHLIERKCETAYLLYTSGSTGTPKGVLVKQTSVVNILHFLHFNYRYHSDDTHLLKTPYVFDVSVSELFMWFLSGGRLSILPKGSEKDPREIAKSISSHFISHINFVPSMFHAFVHVLEPEGVKQLSSLKYIFLAGEALQREHIEVFYKLNSTIRLENLYGPTEATVYSSYYTLDDASISRQIPIGKPIFNTGLYILDQNNRIQPIGVPGELFISGDGLAIGYLNNPELTAAKFIDHPYREGERLYRTGDLARWLPDGNIEFLGRIDHQVKIRGYRVELGEIESTLQKHNLIKECVVLAREDGGDKHLCAYLVLHGELTGEELRDYLSGLLPDYMIPSYFVRLDFIPLTSNGKVDRRSLPAPEVSAGGGYIAPRTPLEMRLVEIWSDILSIAPQEISIGVSFFALGGHSLRATVLVSRIHREFDVRLGLRDIFQHQTVQGQSALIRISEKASYASIPTAKAKEYYPLSSAQKRLYLLQQLDLESTAYNMTGLLRVPKGQNRQQIRDIFRQLIQRHDSFRTSFDIENEQPVQRIHSEVSFSMEEYQIKEEDISMIRENFIRSFNLNHAPLLRVGYLEVFNGVDLLLIDMHHIISDGISLDILKLDFSRILNGEELTPLRLQYIDYCEWQNSDEQQERIKKQASFWLERFADELPVLELPTDFSRPVLQQFEGVSVSFMLSPEETFALRSFCREHGLTIYMSLLSVFTILLSRLSGQEDIIVGSPIAARRHSDLEGVVGMFVNTLVMRNRVSGDMQISDYLQDLKVSTIAAYENQEYPFEDLVEQVVKVRNMSRNPIFDVMFNLLEEIPQETKISKADELKHVEGISKFDLCLTAIDLEFEIELRFEYSVNLFRADTIDQFIAYFRQLLNDIFGNEKKCLNDLNILSEQEKHKLLYDFNDTEREYPRNNTIHEIFEAQVLLTPDKIALEDKERSFSYQELDKESNKIANCLKKRGVRSDQLVGIMADRSIEMIIGILGILKSGGAYVPIDSKYPKERINYILLDSGISILFKAQGINSKYEFTGDTIMLEGDEVEKENICSSRIRNKSNSLAYIMYTSGSTGKPKGVEIEHKSVVRLVKNNNFFPFSSDHKILQTGAPVFDATSFEIWGALLNGGSLYIADSDVIVNADLLGKCIRDNSITTIWLTSSLFNQLVDQDVEIFRFLSYLLVGGDVLSSKHINLIRNKNTKLIIINGYGPTENTTFSTTFNIDKNYIGNIPIGKPISNSTAYIFDKREKLQLVGVSGEFCVGGEGVARGYLNNPELTAAKFIDHPYREGERLYRTGDLARWLPDGNIEFLGRIDQQVKIRGYRVELGEIESTLQKHNQVKECVVVAREEGGDKHLCAYLVLLGKLTSDDLRDYLSGLLPDYMVPSHFVRLDFIPLSSNGKIDRRSLPAPEVSAGGGYIAPRTPLEMRLVEIWSEILSIAPQEISIGVSFFALGGHSLRATTLVLRIHREFDVRLGLRDIFQHQTVQGQSALIRISEKTSYASISTAKAKEHYPLSSAQKRLYLLQQLDPSSTAYNMPELLQVPNGQSRRHVEKYFQQLIQRHDSFRTSFEIVDEMPVQRIHKSIPFSIREYRIEKEELPRVREEFIQPFDLSQAPLLRVGYLEVLGGEDLLLVDMHHIIADGRSYTILSEEFKQLIEGNTLSPLRLQYKDYSEWQNSPEQQSRIKSQEHYWLERLIGELPVLSLPTDYVRPRMQEFEGAQVVFSLTSEETQVLRDICKDQGLTLYMSLLSIFTILLSKLSGQENIIVGSPVAARRHVDLESIVGMFVNTLALRNEVKGVSRLADFLQEVKVNTIEAYENQEYQFEDLVEKLSVDRDTSRNPIFDVMFNLLDGSPREGAEPSSERFMHEPGISKFDLSLTALDFGTVLQLNFEYSTKLFRPESIERYIGYLRRIIAGVPGWVDQPIFEVDMLSAEEKQWLLYVINDTKADYPKDKTIHQLFEEQVERSPDSIALIFEDSRMTFFELNAKSNQLGRVLRGKGVIPDSIVGLLVDRGIETIIGALGILKAGGAYLPIDIDYPDARIDYILNNSNSDTLVTIHSKKQRVRDVKNVIYLEDSNLYSYDSSNLVRVNSSADIAYIIYTSGTTGKPKGVMIEHRNVVRLMINDKFQFDFNSKDVWTMFHSHSFDFSVWEMYGSLLYGGMLVIIPKMIARDPGYYIQILRNECVTILNQTPSVFYGLADEELHFNKSALSIRNVIFGGEALTPNKLIKWREKYPKVKFINMFGITETTVHVTFKEIGSHEIKESVSNIGKPLPTLTTYIVDCNRKLVPVGVSGELCVGGLGVARGYLNNPELTAERFIQNPYNPDERLYCSGDLARIFPDGDMEHLGRIDHQVQLRGFRVELGEIESALLGHEHIKESVVVDREEDGDKYLCAYVVSDGEIDRDELCTYLSGRLPDYMIPSYYVQLEHLPLTSNGKIDRRSLPSPQYRAGSGYEAPSNAIESMLVRIWSEVLNLPQEEISVMASFFSMGGHSLKATVLTGRINRELGVEFPLREVFTCPTIKSQASRIALSEIKGFISIPKAKKQDHYPLSSAQKRMYLLQQMDLGSTAYNMPMIIRLSADTDFNRIMSIFNQLIARHESFRTSFELKDELPIQRIHSDVDFEITVQTIDERDLEKRRTDFIRPFDLFHAPLLRAELLQIKAGDPVLLIDMHHIISDGESHGILVEEFNQLVSGQHLPPLQMQYKDYSEWQNSNEHQEIIQHQESYWIEKFSDELPVLTLPTDYPRPVMQDINGNSVNFLLSVDETAIILDICKEQGLTLYMVMLSAFTILLSKLSGQEDIIVGSPIAARHHADLEGVVGIFVNTLAIRSDVSGHKRLADYFQEFKGKMIEVYENQDYQFEDLVEKVALDRDPSRNPIFDVMFILQNRKKSLLDLINVFPDEYTHEKGVSKFDLSFIVKEFDQQLLLTFEYCTALFKPATIDRFVQYFKHLVRQLPTGLSSQIHEIEILPPEEKDQILKKFNATERNYPVKHVSHELFEQIVYQFPDRTAIVLDESHLTFSTLNQYANKVAKALISRGVQNNRIVAVIADRSLEMIINMIGVVKSGGAYLPLDIDYPIERLKEQLQDSGVEIILSSKKFIDGTIFNRDVLCVDYFTSEFGEDPKVNVSPNDLAYLIYTSGSTGVPKGVEVEHMSLVNMVLSLKERYRIENNERILQFSSPSFDVSVEQIWLSLLSGSTLVLIRQELLHNIDKFESYIEAKGVTHLNVVPTYLSYLNANRKRNVKRVIVGGESLSVDLLKPWVLQSDFYNVYGTTETTVTCTCKYYQKGEELINKVVIGQPIDNSTVYIFDEHLQLSPIGVFGELFIGGNSLARGYHNKESLTNEKFISNPYKPEERLYKTGDRVRWVGSGDIEFLDRIDDQVKVRGYRIELGEVEVNILRHSNVKEVAVATRKDEQGNNYLCAYYVSKNQAKNLAESIKDYLSGILPHYMVPSYFIEMDELPLTPSGKINRKDLPSPKISLRDGYIAPSNKVEETLVRIWSEVLNILPEEISINASFFMLGGHSLKATVLVSRIHKDLDVKLGLKEIFLHQTIEAMAILINASNNKVFIAIPKAEKKFYYKLSSAQKRLFFIQQLNPDNLAYNMPMQIEISNEIGITQVEEVCKVLISRHENFRTSYHIVNGEAIQWIYSEVPFSIKECRIKEDELEGIKEELIKPFNLSQAPLLRVFYLHVENKGSILFFDMHHIISDGASLKILEKEFYQLLAGEKLNPISLQYKDYSEWQSNYEKQNIIKKQEEYWLDMFRGDLPVLNLPTDFPRKALQDYKGNAVEFILSKEETENVKMLSKKSDSTLYMTLLSVLAILLSKLCGQKDIVIGTPVFGRQHNDLEKIVGMFINILAIRYEVKNVKSLLEFVKDVKQNTIEAFDNQDYQFDDLVDKVLKERSLSRNPFFDVLFNLLNFKNFSGDLSQLNKEKSNQGFEASKLDLTLTAVDYGEQLFFSFKYSTSLFKEETIIQFVEYFRGIINQIPSKLNTPVSEINLVDYKSEEDLENCLNMSLDLLDN